MADAIKVYDERGRIKWQPEAACGLRQYRRGEKKLTWARPDNNGLVPKTYNTWGHAHTQAVKWEDA